MKKTLLIIILITTLSRAQERYFVTFGFDPKLATSGAYTYNKKPVADVYLYVGNTFNNNFEFGLGAEYANLNPSYTAFNVYVNKVFYSWNEKWSFTTGPEYLLIDRGRFNHQQKINPVHTFGYNNAIAFYVTDSFSVRLKGRLIHRKDLLKMYQDKTFLKFNGSIEFRIELTR
ncbi:hypothetical protein [Lutibacter sp.]|uniref:hypothetical protein n=1 Tax=Lutibacter sp. TaxID=1925666 RepID=UPI003563E610